jgi:predicted enzyme related to lactoylglutathione lyase
MGMPQVNLYAGVEDLQMYVERAESLGGKIVMPPTKASETTEIAMFSDPQGTSFGLFKSTR